MSEKSYNKFKSSYLYFAECGKTRRMTANFTVIKDHTDQNLNSKMKCTDRKPCFCYGKLCLVSEDGKCNQGNVFIEGTPVCGPSANWNEMLGELICQELGFRGLDSNATGGGLAATGE